MSDYVHGNMKFLWKEVNKVEGGKVESCSEIKDGNGRLALDRDEVGIIWKDYLRIYII